MITLKSGIEGMMKRMIPEVKEVVAEAEVEEPEAEELDIEEFEKEITKRISEREGIEEAVLEEKEAEPELDKEAEEILQDLEQVKKKRGRKPKNATVAAPAIDHAKLLKQFEQEQRVQLETFYKDLVKIKKDVDVALEHVSRVDSSDNVAEAAFKAGRAFNHLDVANDKLEEILEQIYENHDFDHWLDFN